MMDSDFLTPEDARRSYEDDQQIIRTGRAIFDRVEQFKMPDGRHRWLSSTKVPITDRDGLISGLACVCRDITGLKTIEESLRLESARLRLLQAVTVASAMSPRASNRRLAVACNAFARTLAPVPAMFCC